MQRLFRPDFHGDITDVYDGEGYRAQSTFLSEPSHFSLLLNTGMYVM